MQAKKTKVSIIIAREQRRRQVAEFLQQSMTEAEIAQLLKVDPSTVCRDVQALKEAANEFVYSLAKNDLCFFYHQTIADIDHVRAECWKLYHAPATTDDGISFIRTNPIKVSTKDRLQALRTILQADIARFELLSRGEVVMSVKSLNERIDAIKLA
jgi:hypothetical protein